MVEAAKSCASNPGDRQSQDALKRAAEHLRSTTHAAVGTTLRRKVIKVCFYLATFDVLFDR